MYSEENYQYMNDDDYGYYEEVDENFLRVYQYCVLPTIMQTSHFIMVLLMHSLAFHGLTKYLANKKDNMHIASTVLGLFYVFGFALDNIVSIYVIPLVLLSYNAIYHLNAHSVQPVVAIAPTFAVILIACEFFGPPREDWLKMRSVVMIAMMKIISLACELYKSKEMPSLLEYNGYIWCPANVVVGPWISFKQYKARESSRTVLDLAWIWSIVKYVSLATVFACVSNCLGTFIIEDDNNVFVVAFRRALCFRMSHYFISYSASAAMVAAGFRNEPDRWAYQIANPQEIEFPRSLASVFTNWNVPTHTFLKRYVFPTALPYGYFAAITVTFLVSSVLHGMSVEVSVVLLSLGLFSYAQTKFQDRLAVLLDCCVRVKPCKNCRHSRTRTSQIAALCNRHSMLTTVVMLMYVGCLMDDVAENHSTVDILQGVYGKWSELYGVGHFITLFYLTFICVTC